MNKLKHYQKQNLRYLVIALMAMYASFSAKSENVTNINPRLFLTDNNIDGFAQANVPRTFTFPDDHGAHPKFKIEWWYITALLKTPSNREFGLQFTIFRYALSPHSDRTNAWRDGQAYMGHFAVSDIQNQRHIEFERLSRGHPELAGVQTLPFEIFIEDWKLQSQASAFHPLRLSLKEGGVQAILNLESTKPIFLHGENGWSKKNETLSSYYYSVPRMKTSGYITIDDRTFEVAGTSWMDREWSSQLLAKPFVGWDWFTLQFDSGLDFVLFKVRADEQNLDVQGVATTIKSNGNGKTIPWEGVQLKPIRYWQKWPVAWSLIFNEEPLTVVAAFDDQVMNTSIEYWEGVVNVLNQAGERIGRGYMELTGYQ